MFQHIPVMPVEVAGALRPVIHSAWLDCTLGQGGHAELLLQSTPPTARLIGLDMDPENLASVAERLSPFSGRFHLVHANFAHAAQALRDAGVERVDALLADLGVSTNQIFDVQRGLSFDRDGPLDMRLDPREPLTAADLVNGMRESELADLFYVEAQERHSRRISKRICEARRRSRIRTTGQLAEIVARALGGRRGKLHPATRVFMALRIAVNRERENLAALLETAPRLLRAGGRVAVISFHSGEDRRVKEDFRSHAASGFYRLLTKRPWMPGDEETRANPASRSAKLRVAERTEKNLSTATQS